MTTKYTPETRLAVDRAIAQSAGSNRIIAEQLGVPPQYVAERRFLANNRKAREFRRAAILAEGGNK